MSSSSTGSKKASLMPCTQASTCHWLTSSTQVMWYTPLRPSRSPWWTLSTRMKPARPAARGALRTPMALHTGRVLVNEAKITGALALIASTLAQVVQVRD